MSRRGLVVALLCGALGLGLGMVVAYAGEPRTSYSDNAHPISAVSPSVPIDQPTHEPYAKDIDYPRLSPDLAIPQMHTIRNRWAVWSYHTPLGWQAYWVCGGSQTCRPGTATDDPMPPAMVDKVREVRFRPPGEPPVGGYSLRVRILDNTFIDLRQTVATKIVGFKDSTEVAEFHIIHRSDSSVYFEYRDAGTNFHRFNYFQWFAVPGETNATLEMSVSGRKSDVPGLKNLFNRFADQVNGAVPPAGKSAKP